MVQHAFLILLSLTAFSHPAQAQNVREAWKGESAPNQMKLVGKGLQKRKAGDQLFWACKDQSCAKIQPVYYNQEQQLSYFVGREIETNGNIKDSIKRYMGCFSDFKNYMTHADYRFANTSLPVLGGLLGLGAMLVSPPLGAVILAGGLTPVLLHSFRAFDGTGPVQDATISQEGWNWSSRPKRLSQKRFGLYLYYIEWDFYRHHPEYKVFSSYHCSN